jgi:decaprenylphospho-beta-D-erythro-pentofuranosid-2-ulose 2-reductase
MKRIVAVGAISAIAEGCLRVWASEPARFVLVGRDGEALHRIAADLRVRSQGTTTEVHVGSFAGAAEIAATVAAAAAAPIDVALIAFGTLPRQAELTGSPAALAETLQVNGVWPTVFAQLVFERLVAQGHGHLAVIGSVAGDRGRKSNYAYGSGKAMSATFVRGLQHSAAGTDVKVSLIKPGPTDTPMARRVDVRGNLAPVPKVAAEIVTAVNAGQAVVYTPKLWRIIMLVIRLLPDFLFNRLNV